MFSFPHHWEVLVLSLDTQEPRASSSLLSLQAVATVCYQEVSFPRAVEVTPAQAAPTRGTEPARGADGAADPPSTECPPSPILHKEWPQLSKQGLRAVTRKRADVWEGSQLAKCHYRKRWAMPSSLTPGFLLCLPSWMLARLSATLLAQIFCPGMAEKRLLVAPDICMMGWFSCFLWPHHSPLRQDGLCHMEIPESPSWESC